MEASGWAVLGAPWDCSGTGRGEADAPAALRRAGLGDLAGLDAGDAPIAITTTARDPATGVRALAETRRAADALTAALTSLLARAPDRRPLVVGGDCSLLLGVVPAVRALGPVGLWFVDGHPDYQAPADSATGETADLELGLVTGDGPDALTGLAGPPPMVPPAAAVLIGHRAAGLDAAAAAEVARVPEAVRRIDAATLVADPAAAGERARGWLDGSGRSVWLHLDLDVLDPSALPAVTYPQPGGPDWDALAAALRPLATSPHLSGVSVADFRPDLDPGGGYAARVVALLDAVLP
ncbi:arginase family protein [Phytohabitans sp. ZYX-F-186]|uniref:Arginase family protein n=1 Tax=Phytohabitans maris TaxID=3071409 RepID=A0ABU0ZH24_9ACTN|nr:arginase family protein [Phytohabitans sp. ZYX-F-186]MDQ7906342.1 arginase family protein [Phytohabitans sp. ZYX-F-186]